MENKRGKKKKLSSAQTPGQNEGAHAFAVWYTFFPTETAVTTVELLKIDSD